MGVKKQQRTSPKPDSRLQASLLKGWQSGCSQNCTTCDRAIPKRHQPAKTRNRLSGSAARGSGVLNRAACDLPPANVGHAPTPRTGIPVNASHIFFQQSRLF